MLLLSIVQGMTTIIAEFQKNEEIITTLQSNQESEFTSTFSRSSSL